MLLLAWSADQSSAQGRRRGQSKREAEMTILATFHGKLGTIGKGKVEIEVENENTMVFQTSRKTRYLDGDKEIKPPDMEPGARIAIEGRRALDGVLEAVVVRIERDGTSKKKAASGK